MGTLCIHSLIQRSGLHGTAGNSIPHETAELKEENGYEAREILYALVTVFCLDRAQPTIER